MISPTAVNACPCSSSQATMSMCFNGIADIEYQGQGSAETYVVPCHAQRCARGVSIASKSVACSAD